MGMMGCTEDMNSLLGVRNEEGVKIMDFATAYQMRLMNT